MYTLDIDQFVKSYLATAAWVTVDSDECNEFTKEAKLSAKDDCELFIRKVVYNLGNAEAEKLLTIPGNDLTYLAPHDFFLTRNGHGAGFWDKEDIYGEDNARILTEISKEMKGVDCIHIRGKKSKLTFC